MKCLESVYCLFVDCRWQLSLELWLIAADWHLFTTMKRTQSAYLNKILHSKWGFDEAIESVMKQQEFNEEQALFLLCSSLVILKSTTADAKG